MTRMGFQIPGFDYPGVADDELFEAVARIAVTAEEAGFDSLWVMDHFEQLAMLGGVDRPILEGWVTLGALAARTSRARLGTLVTGVTYRNPAMLAKMATTLDVISGGRAMLGIGAAWFDEEHDAYGFEFPGAGERLDRLEEALRICRAMFSEEKPSFTGEHYRIHEARNLPRPVQPGGPPILIGGGGERRTLRLVAQYGDLCNVFGDADTVRHKVEVLERHCAEVGRDPDEIVKTKLATVIAAPTEEQAREKVEATLGAMGMSEEQAAGFALWGGPETLAAQARAQREAGLDGLIVNLLDPYDLDVIPVVAEAVGAAFA